MKHYTGTKNITAKPMNRLAYNMYRNWKLPDDENGEDEGYLVEYEPHPTNKPNHPKHEGYISWSPKAVFESTYQGTDGKVTDTILMGTDNHDGWELEKLLLKLQNEVKAKSDKIKDSNHPQRGMILRHNAIIVTKLQEAELFQRETYRQLDAVAPNKGPGKPRL